MTSTILNSNSNKKYHLVFDLDGVLVDYGKLHRTAFIDAWNFVFTESHYQIDIGLHSSLLEARTTKQKINILKHIFFNSNMTESSSNEDSSLDLSLNVVNTLKQEFTKQQLKEAPINKSVQDMLHWAHESGYSFSCCSNSIRSTVIESLSKLVPLEWFSHILSNEDVCSPKPAPDIYLELLYRTGLDPSEVIVFEDSPVGRESAQLAGIQNIIEVVDSFDLSPTFLNEILNSTLSIFPSISKPTRPLASKFNIVIPMAGLGSRFQKEGYKTPKPFLPINDKPMFIYVIQNIVPPIIQERAEIYLIVREEMMSLFDDAVATIPNLHIHSIPKLTEGAASTVLTLREIINNDTPLIIANSDQFLEWNAMNFYYSLSHPDWNGGVISTFFQPDRTDLRWSYAKVDETNKVIKVEEKVPISDLATTGIYGWKKGCHFVKYAEKMIELNIRVNNEFYVCPVYNLAIEDGLRIRPLNVEKMWGLGVPTDYELYLSHLAKLNTSL